MGVASPQRLLVFVVEDEIAIVLHDEKVSSAMVRVGGPRWMVVIVDDDVAVALHDAASTAAMSVRSPQRSSRM